ncbi:hypothetical protein ACQPW1_47345 [Nocardia sp. CA-128927]|uniref:hypothetical protein n=1 Tax=Nocardia sp. CA-128927 TaxID=3239975 RepID=UPI003D96592F
MTDFSMSSELAEEDRFCKIFVRNAEPSVLMKLIAGLLGGRFEIRSLTLPTATVDVLRNPEVRGDSVEFIFWPSLVEIEAQESIDAEEMIAVTRRILIALWDAGLSAVAACGFEDELPWRGGIDRLSPQ